MKKYLTAVIILLLLLLGGWGTMELFGDTPKETPTAEKSKQPRQPRIALSVAKDDSTPGADENAGGSAPTDTPKDNSAQEFSNEEPTHLPEDVDEDQRPEEDYSLTFSVYARDALSDKRLLKTWATWKLHDGVEHRVNADEKGDLAITMAYEGRVTFHAKGYRAQTRIFERWILDLPTWDPHMKRVNLFKDVSDRVYRVRCVDSKGEPVMGIGVDLYFKDHSGFNMGRDVPSVSITNRDGVAELRRHGEFKYNKQSSFVVHRISQSGEHRAWATLRMTKAHFDGELATLVLTDANFVRGRVLDAQGHPLEGVGVTVGDCITSPGGFHPYKWHTYVTTNAEGVFLLATGKLNFVRASVNSLNVRGLFPAIKAKPEGTTDLGTIQVERILKFTARAIFNGKPLFGARIEMKDTPTNVSGGGSDHGGEKHLYYWTRSQVLAKAEEPMIRFKHRRALSPWVSIRSALLKEEMLDIELKPLAEGRIKANFADAETDTSKVKIHVQGLERDHQRWLFNEKLDESRIIYLVYGPHPVWFTTKEGKASPLYRVRIKEGETSEIDVRLLAKAELQCVLPTLPADAKLGFQLRFEDGFNQIIFPKDVKGNRRAQVLPETPLTLYLSYTRRGEEASRTLEIEAFAAGETRDFDLEAAIKPLIDKVNAARAESQD